jgi:hypothetical protein
LGTFLDKQKGTNNLFKKKKVAMLDKQKGTNELFEAKEMTKLYKQIVVYISIHDCFNNNHAEC